MVSSIRMNQASATSSDHVARNLTILFNTRQHNCSNIGQEHNLALAFNPTRLECASRDTPPQARLSRVQIIGQ